MYKYFYVQHQDIYGSIKTLTRFLIERGAQWEHGELLRACLGQYYKTDATMGVVMMKTLKANEALHYAGSLWRPKALLEIQLTYEAGIL